MQIECDYNDSIREILYEWRQCVIIPKTLDAETWQKYTDKANKYHAKFLKLINNGGEVCKIIWCYQLHTKYCTLLAKTPQIWLEQFLTPVAGGPVINNISFTYEQNNDK